MASQAVSPASGRTSAERNRTGLDTIRKSHERSQNFGLSASMRPDYCVLSAAELALKVGQNRILCTHALPVMETLYGQIVNTHSMVVLTDAEGLILHSLGDDDFLRRADKVALRAGAIWTEQQQGTNAIGTAIAEAQATTIYGDQHFLRANQFLACSSVPILDPYGKLLGVLDVTGDCRSHHQHTMALARMSAQMIENHLFASTFTEALRIHFHSRVEFIGTLMEGIAAFRADGTFLSANRSAQFQLGLPLAALRMQTLSSLFNESSATLINRCASGSLPQETLSICLHNGVTVFAHVDFRHASLVTSGARELTAVPASDASPAQGGRPEPKLSSLRYLDTGDARMSSLIGRLRKVIGKDIPILVDGETGTGKDVLALAIHRDSPRAQGPFVALNCGSIPETLIEAELFGFAEGAFTGAAKRGSTGKIFQADGGTLFLDEIGDMPFALQSRLLRTLQARTVTPLGSSKEVPVDFALICATHRNLREMVASGAFREDLYYRINGMLVTLPPLCERTDLPLVVDKILRAERFAGRRLSVAAEVLALFARHPWPGNFRQLTNVLRTAAAMLDEHETIVGLAHLPQDFVDETDDRARPADPIDPALAPCVVDTPRGERTDVRLDEVTSSIIAATLAHHRGNISAAARALGVSRSTLYRKIASLPGQGRHVDETR
jgi:transcriptional regulator of acetoin/glycerol metabolism